MPRALTVLGYLVLAVVLGLAMWLLGGQDQPLLLGLWSGVCAVAGAAGGLWLRRQRRPRTIKSADRIKAVRRVLLISAIVLLALALSVLAGRFGFDLQAPLWIVGFAAAGAGVLNVVWLATSLLDRTAARSKPD